MGPTNKNRTAMTLGAVLLVAVVSVAWYVTSGRGNHATSTNEQPNTAMTQDHQDAAAPASATTVSSTTTAAPGGTQANVTDATASVPEKYTVVAGDTLEKLAQKFYNDGKLFGFIEDANKDVLKGNPDALVPGMVLNMPKLDSVKPALAAPAATGSTGTTPSGATGTTPSGTNGSNNTGGSTDGTSGNTGNTTPSSTAPSTSNPTGGNTDSPAN